MLAMFKDNYKSLLTPENSAVIFLDDQPQMFFGVQSIDRGLLINNIIGLAKAAKVFKVPTILTSISADSFSGAVIEGLQSVFPNLKPIDRTSMNAWEDKHFLTAIEKLGRKKLIMSGLWTEVCLTFPALCALADGYEVYAVEDASGGESKAAHRMGMQRMIQAGAIPVTWQQVMYEWQRDWARQETSKAVGQIAKEHSGAFGVGISYAHTMFKEEREKTDTTY